MRINDRTIHERAVHAYFEEADLEAILAKKVADETGFSIDRATKIRVIISKKDRPGTAGFESYAEVILTNALSPNVE